MKTIQYLEMKFNKEREEDLNWNEDGIEKSNNPYGQFKGKPCKKDEWGRRWDSIFHLENIVQDLEWISKEYVKTNNNT